MQQHHRRRHRWIWWALLPILVGAILVAVQTRPELRSAAHRPSAGVE